MVTVPNVGLTPVVEKPSVFGVDELKSRPASLVNVAVMPPAVIVASSWLIVAPANDVSCSSDSFSSRIPSLSLSKSRKSATLSPSVSTGATPAPPLAASGIPVTASTGPS